MGKKDNIIAFVKSNGYTISSKDLLFKSWIGNVAALFFVFGLTIVVKEFDVDYISLTITILLLFLMLFILYRFSERSASLTLFMGVSCVNLLLIPTAGIIEITKGSYPHVFGKVCIVYVAMCILALFVSFVFARHLIINGAFIKDRSKSEKGMKIETAKKLLIIFFIILFLLNIGLILFLRSQSISIQSICLICGLSIGSFGLVYLIPRPFLSWYYELKYNHC